MTGTDHGLPQDHRAHARGLDAWDGLRDELMRPPTAEEAHRFGRSAQGDLVFVVPGASDGALLDVARAMIEAGSCAVTHVLSGVGVYLEQ